MSEGLMCLRCRKYVGTKPSVSEPCECADPLPSLDGKTLLASPGPTGTAGEPSEAQRREIVSMIAGALYDSPALSLSTEEADARAEGIMATYDRLCAAAAGAAPADGCAHVFTDNADGSVTCFECHTRYLRSGGAAPASPAVREAAARVLVQMPAEPGPDPLTGEYPLVYLSVTAPIWDALDVLRAALDAEGAEEQQ